jgi:putative membrane protein
MLELIPLAMTLLPLAGYGIVLYRLRRCGVRWPVTLGLCTLPRRPRRILLRLLHSFPVAVLAAPVTAVVLDLGGLYALYLTGLYQDSEHNTVAHAAVHVHMVLAGRLLSWAVIGIDPVRRRPGTRVRLTALIIAGAGHDTLTELI